MISSRQRYAASILVSLRPSLALLSANERPGAILSLLSSFPGDSTLREYLRCAVTDENFPVNLWHLLPAFLRSVRATEHDASTLDMLCQLILNLHYESQAPPLGSLVPYSELLSELLDTISDSLYLLRLSYEFAASPFHHLTASASDLLILTLSCVVDMSEVSTAQATVLLSEVHDVLQIVSLQDNVRQALDSFLLSLSMLLGDGTKQAEEAEMFASFQLTPGKQDVVGPNPSLDLLTGSLIMARLVSLESSCLRQYCVNS
jgi:mediator of RNA polymerase II transcription subunit 5